MRIGALIAANSIGADRDRVCGGWSRHRTIPGVSEFGSDLRKSHALPQTRTAAAAYLQIIE